MGCSLLCLVSDVAELRFRKLKTSRPSQALKLIGSLKETLIDPLKAPLDPFKGALHSLNPKP